MGHKNNKTLQKRYTVLTPMSLLIYKDEGTFMKNPQQVTFVFPL